MKLCNLSGGRRGVCRLTALFNMSVPNPPKSRYTYEFNNLFTRAAIVKVATVMSNQGVIPLSPSWGGVL